MTPADRRAAVVQAALAVVGMGAHDPEAYLDLVGPGESAEARRGMLTMSGCALVAAGVLRRAGLEAPELAPPYRIGSAVSRLVALARRCGAWCRSSRDAAPPRPGSVIIIGGPEHVLTVVDVTASHGMPFVESVDGGQRDDAGRQVVLARSRMWQLGCLGGRIVTGWIDVGALPIASRAERDAAEVYGV